MKSSLFYHNKTDEANNVGVSNLQCPYRCAKKHHSFKHPPLSPVTEGGQIHIQMVAVSLTP